LALTINGSEDAANACLKRLDIVTRDEIAALWPLVESIARTLFARRTLTAVEIAAELARARSISASSSLPSTRP
jgi:hypothetical protein